MGDLSGRLDDTVFVHAAEAMVELSRLIEEAVGEKPTLEDFCDVVTEALRCCEADDLFDDVNSSAIERLSATVTSKTKIRVKPGDVFGIPSSAGGYFLAVHVTRNRFGDAFGALDHHAKFPRLSSAARAASTLYPVYTGTQFVVSRRWRRLGHDAELLERFPNSPEILHEKSSSGIADAIGPFGSAETASGELRDLSEAEAIEFGLAQGHYRQVMLEEQFEDFLNARILGEPPDA